MFLPEEVLVHKSQAHAFSISIPTRNLGRDIAHEIFHTMDSAAAIDGHDLPCLDVLSLFWKGPIRWMTLWDTRTCHRLLLWASTGQTYLGFFMGSHFEQG